MYDGATETFGYDLNNSDFVGLMLGIEHGQPIMIHLGPDRVVYTFLNGKTLVMSAEEIEKKAAQDKPVLCAFLSRFYGMRIDDLTVRGDSINLSGVGYPFSRPIDTQEFRRTIDTYGTLLKELGTGKVLLYGRGIDPRLAAWVLKQDYGTPVTVKDVRDGKIILDAEGEVSIPESKFRKTTESIKSQLIEACKELYKVPTENVEIGEEFVEIGSGESARRIPIEDFENNVKDHCKKRIEYLVRLNDVPYEGADLLKEASPLGALEALATVKEASARFPNYITMLGTEEEDAGLVVKTFKDGDGRITTELFFGDLDQIETGKKPGLPKISRRQKTRGLREFPDLERYF